jgi:signal transduction histidine kinase
MGELIVSPRSPEESFTRADISAITDHARHAGVAARTIRLNADLQQARERLVLAREEERRRLRRDLHDGIGPALVGMSMQIGAAGTMLRDGDTTGTAQLLATVERELGECTAEVRTLVRNLRPPALDERGLLGAIQEQISHLTGHDVGPAVTIKVPGDNLAGLPAAVEVAALRITVEAVANAVRHSGASSCTAALSRTREGLLIEVEDDGEGVDPSAPAGAGITSMNERAAELGGTCEVRGTGGRGTIVHAVLPVPDRSTLDEAAVRT